MNNTLRLCFDCAWVSASGFPASSEVDFPDGASQGTFMCVDEVERADRGLAEDIQANAIEI